MKRIVLYTLVGVLLLAIIAGVFGVVSFLNFMKPGIHSLAGYTKMDFQETVYFVNADTKKVDGSSTVTISGIIQPVDAAGESLPFNGSMSVAQYPKSLESGYDYFVASASNGMISLTCRHTLNEGVAYWLIMNEKDPSIYAVHIYLEDGQTVTAYPGGNEQEAVANCEAYWQWFQTIN